MSGSKDKSRSSGSEHQVPNVVVSRLSLYLRELQHVVREGRETINSTDLGNLLGLTDAQVRKDLAHFGQFGYPGVGYRCEELAGEIKRILGTDREWPVALVGAGNLGQALLGYRGFGQQGFRFVAAFDVDPSKVGTTIGGIAVHPVEQLRDIVNDLGIRLAVIAVPTPAAQSVADQLVATGVEGVLNFAPVTISLPPGVRLVGVDLAIELEQLAFAVVKKEDRP